MEWLENLERKSRIPVLENALREVNTLTSDRAKLFVLSVIREKARESNKPSAEVLKKKVDAMISELEGGGSGEESVERRTD